MAYKEYIGQNLTKNKKDDENQDSHQTSPGYVLTFVRLQNRDTENYEMDSLETREPLVVVSDAVSINISYSKSNPSPTLSCVLKQGDVNYITAVAPGDYVLANMLNWEKDAMEVRKKAIKKEPINTESDGFKGLFKVLDVNMTLITNNAGTKQYYTQITARAFDEFNSILYFNPALPEALSNSGGYLSLNALNNFHEVIRKREKDSNVQNLIKEVIKRTVGQGIGDILKKSDTKLNQIPAYKIPNTVGNLLGLKNVNYIADINKYYLGIWPSSSTGYASFFKETSKNKEKEYDVSFFETGDVLQGSRTFAFEDFQYVKTWSLLVDYSNPTLNESYTCFRKAPNGNIYPSVIVRQKPFTTNHFESFVEKNPPKVSPSKNTKFLSLPRWEISPYLITSFNLGRSDNGRINFVMLSTKTQSIEGNLNDSLQIALGNYVEDKRDIIRNGRKPYIANCNFDSANSSIPAKAREWALLVADWLFNGHLKMNGTMETIGIQDPICVGDNLEFDGIVYHIETISHKMDITSEGTKIFRTTLSLSYGMSANSTSQIPIYAQMDHPTVQGERNKDYQNNKILPGYSDSQDLPERTLGEEVGSTVDVSFTNPKKGK